MSSLKQKIQQLCSSFSFDKEVPRKDRKPITIWVCPEEKMQYDVLQARSSKEFSKLVQSVVRETIKTADDTLPSEVG